MSGVFEYNYSNRKNNLLTMFLRNIFYVEIFWIAETIFSPKEKLIFLFVCFQGMR